MWESVRVVTPPILVALENLGSAAAENTHSNTEVQTIESDFDRHCCALIQQSSQSYNGGGWAAELHRYLDDLPTDVTKDTDIMQWWQVSGSITNSEHSIQQDHAKLFPTLSRIAKDICAILATSVPCEQLFSAGAEIVTDRHNCLGAERFEHLQVLKHAWHSDTMDLSVINSSMIEEVPLEPFKEFLAWDNEHSAVRARK
jgi:hypothetical protein